MESVIESETGWNRQLTYTAELSFEEISSESVKRGDAMGPGIKIADRSPEIFF